MTAPTRTTSRRPPDDEPAEDTLSALDWIVIIAATAALGILLAWLVQGQPAIPTLLHRTPAPTDPA